MGYLADYDRQKIAALEDKLERTEALLASLQVELEQKRKAAKLVPELVDVIARYTYQDVRHAAKDCRPELLASSLYRTAMELLKKAGAL